MEGVGGVKREGGLEGLGKSDGSGVQDEDREEEAVCEELTASVSMFEQVDPGPHCCVGRRLHSYG